MGAFGAVSHSIAAQTRRKRRAGGVGVTAAVAAQAMQSGGGSDAVSATAGSGGGGASAAPIAPLPFFGGGGGASAAPGPGAGRTFAASPAAAAAKVDAICAGGTALLHVIIDWDRTCTTFMHNGRKGDTCHGVVESRRGPELLARARALNARYLPIETDPSLPHEEKIPHMRDWYAAVNGLLAASGITREDLREDVRAANLGLREGIPQLLRASVARGFPVTILSAGIGDVIEEALALLVGPLPPHIRVASNKMVWEGGVCVGFTEPTIHSACVFLRAVFLKAPRPPPPPPPIASPHPRAHPSQPLLPSAVFNKTSAFAFDEAERLRLGAERPHVLLLGDSDGDATMAEGLDAKVLLKIGILNDAAAAEAALPKYLRLFDVVVVDDPPLWPLLDIMHRLGV